MSKTTSQPSAQAIARGVKGSYTKAQLVMDLIRGKSVEKALAELTFCRKNFARPAKKLLQSAIANAEHNSGLNVDKLVVAAAFADKGMVMKRWHARARGRAGAIQKARCHLTIVVAEKAAEAKKPEAKKAPAKKAEVKSQESTEKTEA